MVEIWEMHQYEPLIFFGLSGNKVLSYANFGTWQCFNTFECRPLVLVNSSCLNLFIGILDFL